MPRATCTLPTGRGCRSCTEWSRHPESPRRPIQSTDRETDRVARDPATAAGPKGRILSKITAKLIATVSASLLALGLSGCSVGPIAEAPPAPDTSTTDGDGASDSGDSGDTGSDGDDGRVFIASQEIVAKSLLAAISKAERVEWEGK